MKNVKLLALVLALALLLTGCSSKKESKDIEAVRVGSVSYTMQDLIEVENALKAEYDYYNQMYAMYGMTYGEYTAEDLRSQALESLAVQAVLFDKAATLKLDRLTDAEKDEVYALAENDWYYYRDSYAQTITVDEDATKEERSAAIDAAMAEAGITWDAVYTSAWRNYILDKTENYMIRDAKVTEEAFKAGFDAQVAADKETFGENAGAYVDALLYGQTSYYTPAGCRYVKQILIQYTEEDQALVDEANAALVTAKNAASTAKADAAALLGEDADLEALLADVAAETAADLTEEQTAALKALADAQAAEDAAAEAYDQAVETALANIAPEADEVLARIAAGDDWDALTDEYNDDPGMMDGQETAETGYAVAAGMTVFDTAFVDAAMSLEAIGDYTDKTVGESYGYYIIKYIGDIPEGAVDAETVREELTASLLQTEQQNTYDATLNKWVEEANIQINYEKVWEGFDVQ